jgi:hypothetical protein
VTEQPASPDVGPQSRAPQAQPGAFWRDRGLWLQLVIQSAVFFLFGAMDAGNAFSFGPEVPSWVLVTGYALVFVGLLVQRWRAETGLTVVAVGLVVGGRAAWRASTSWPTSSSVTRRGSSPRSSGGGAGCGWRC